MKKIGILGGGQLGRMFIQNALNYPVEIHVIDPDAQAPCSGLTPHFTQGSFQDYDTVMKFGKDLDVITIEIEKVNTRALKDLQTLGKKVVPTPEVIELIQDKAAQNKFYADNHLPTPHFDLTDEQTPEGFYLKHLPFVQKTRRDGYDGKGVQIIKQAADLNKLFKEPALIEELVDYEKELGVVVSVGKNQYRVFEPVEMVFDPDLNLVDYIMAPADLPLAVREAAMQLALQTALAFQSEGIFAIELFLLKSGELLVNETAPRVHNSAHLTIEANHSSQYDQLLRILLELPLGDIGQQMPAAMLNLIGAEGEEGETAIKGLQAVAQMPKTYLHLYGKTFTKPGRKMGHITLLAEDADTLKERVKQLKKEVQIVAKNSN